MPPYPVGALRCVGVRTGGDGQRVDAEPDHELLGELAAMTAT
jgi:hypothetical protein